MTKRSLYARARVALTLAATICLTPGPAAGLQQADPPPCAACIVLIAAPGQAVTLPAEPLNGVEIIIGGGADEGAIANAVATVAEAGGRPGLLVAGSGQLPQLARHAAIHRVLISEAPAGGSVEERLFRLKTRLTEVRGSFPDALVGVLIEEAEWPSLEAGGIDAYLDFRASTDRSSRLPFPVRGLEGDSPLKGTATFSADQPRLIVRASAAAARPDPARWIVGIGADIVRARAAVSDVARTALTLSDTLIAGGMAEVRCGADAIATYLDAETLATVAVVPTLCAAPAVSPQMPGTEQVTVSTGETVIRVPSSEGRFAEGVRVTGARRLTVREVIARHQASAARQRRAVRQLISTGSMTLTFEAPGFSAPMAITSQAVIYTGPDAVEIEQRDIRVNGIAFGGSRVPRLPLLEPERVASPPLAITLNDLYTYRLDGEDSVDGLRCYVVSFTPVDPRRSLFAGRVWIAMDTFAMVRVSAVQTGLRGPIVSSEQTDHFRPNEGGLWLLARSEVRQLYEGAGHRTPIHRVLAIDRQEVNPPAFAERRRQAYASPAVMLRDTPAGFRYLLREAPSTSSATAGAAPAAVTLAGPSQRVRTLALGVIIDPNISRPLPFAGLSYVDFNLFGTGTQVNGFFGGTYGQLAVSVPSLAGSRWQLAGRAFGIASSYNDRAFVNGRERYEWNISQRPAHASTWLLRPLSARASLRAGYELDYTAFNESESTAAEFVVPAAQVSHGLRVALEAQWRGWSSSLWWTGARRSGWQAWGDPAGLPGVVGAGEYRDEQRDYQRAGVMLARSLVFSPRLVGRVEASYMAGRDLDRFSRYTFGSFDNRLRGYPSALIRYDRGGVLRGAAAWSAGRFLRLDGFLDSAVVHDPGFGARLRNYTGVGGAAELPAPFGTLVAVEWGYGFQGLNADGRRGTQVLRISGYKIF